MDQSKKRFQDFKVDIRKQERMMMLKKGRQGSEIDSQESKLQEELFLLLQGIESTGQLEDLIPEITSFMASMDEQDFYQTFFSSDLISKEAIVSQFRTKEERNDELENSKAVRLVLFILVGGVSHCQSFAKLIKSETKDMIYELAVKSKSPQEISTTFFFVVSMLENLKNDPKFWSEKWPDLFARAKDELVSKNFSNEVYIASITLLAGAASFQKLSSAHEDLKFYLDHTLFLLSREEFEYFSEAQELLCFIFDKMESLEIFFEFVDDSRSALLFEALSSSSLDLRKIASKVFISILRSDLIRTKQFDDQISSIGYCYITFLELLHKNLKRDRDLQCLTITCLFYLIQTVPMIVDEPTLQILLLEMIIPLELKDTTSQRMILDILDIYFKGVIGEIGAEFVTDNPEILRVFIQLLESPDIEVVELSIKVLVNIHLMGKEFVIENQNDFSFLSAVFMRHSSIYELLLSRVKDIIEEERLPESTKKEFIVFVEDVQTEEAEIVSEVKK